MDNGGWSISPGAFRRSPQGQEVEKRRPWHMGHVVFGKQGSAGIIKLPILKGSNKANVRSFGVVFCKSALLGLLISWPLSNVLFLLPTFSIFVMTNAGTLQFPVIPWGPCHYRHCLQPKYFFFKSQHRNWKRMTTHTQNITDTLRSK